MDEPTIILGAQIAIAVDRRPMGVAEPLLEADDVGNPAEDSSAGSEMLVLTVVPFIELRDGTTVLRHALDEAVLEVPRGSTLEELEGDVREIVLQTDMIGGREAGKRLAQVIDELAHESEVTATYRPGDALPVRLDMADGVDKLFASTRGDI